jgi:uncharacterized repeat protein (TIGR03803 family)
MKFRISGLIAIAIAFALAGQSRAATPNLTTLVSFCSLPNCADGAGPQAGLIADANGNLFGTTEGGGASGGGTVFEIAKTASGYASIPTTLVSFCSLPNCADGSGPTEFAPLIADANGNLFGTTGFGGAGAYGGNPNGAGTVFEIVKTASGYASTPTTLVSFCSLPNCADGATPYAGLIADANGNLFGTTSGGGAYAGIYGGGTVFEIVKTASGYATTPTILYSFCAQTNCTDGSGPLGGLIADANGNLFGTTGTGGANNDAGTVFEIVKTASGYASTPTILVSFGSLPADGALPVAALIADANGNLFGTTSEGGASGYYGTVFEIVKTASGYASTPITLVSFCSLPNCADGANPNGGVIADANGNLFGTTALGLGTVFEIAKTASGYASTPTTLVRFCSLPKCADGKSPLAGLIADANGNLFGTTSEGGGVNDVHLGAGTVFEITGSGFVPPPLFAGTPGNVGCIVKSNATLRRDYQGLNNAAADLGYPSVQALEMTILTYCWGI